MKGQVYDIKGGYMAFYNDENTKIFSFSDFDMAINCLNAAYKFLNDCKEKGLIASV